MAKGGSSLVSLSPHEPQADDVFVESSTSAHVRAPRFSAEGRQARLAVDGMENPSQMKGSLLTNTLSRGESGFAQTVTAQ